MEDTAVTRIGDQNFEILSCENIADFTEDDDVTNKILIQRVLRPLTMENYDESFIQSIESKVNKFLLNACKQPDGISNMDFKDDEKKEYKILFHKAMDIKFGFLVRLLSAAQMSEIERNAVGKTYMTGDMSDLWVTKEDFH